LLLLSDNNTIVPLFPSGVRTAQQSQRGRFRQHGSGLAFGLCKIDLILLKVHFFNAWREPRKERQKRKQECNMENMQLTQDFRSLQSETPVSALFPVQSVSSQ